MQDQSASEDSSHPQLALNAHYALCARAASITISMYFLKRSFLTNQMMCNGSSRLEGHERIGYRESAWGRQDENFWFFAAPLLTEGREATTRFP
jgi:hypothetical protein